MPNDPVAQARDPGGPMTETEKARAVRVASEYGSPQWRAAFWRGYDAGREGRPADQCPYFAATKGWRNCWMRGWRMGSEAFNASGPVSAQDKLRSAIHEAVGDIAGDALLDAYAAAIRAEERERMEPLVAFARWALAEMRTDGGGDIDGGAAEDKAQELGLLVYVTVAESCGPECWCAGYYDEFPAQCLRENPAVTEVPNG